MQAAVPSPAELASRWMLDPDVDHLNHGSFGATPRPVLEAQRRWRDRMERNPVVFMMETYQEQLELARSALATFIGATSSSLVFVNNATTGVNAILRSTEELFGEGDEILVTDHGYNACVNAAEVSAGKRGALVRHARVPFPVASEDDVLAAVLDAVTDRTRLVIVDHVTSPTALVLPVHRIVAALEPDIAVLVDAAHAPGMLALDVDALGASYVVGNCHKWMCAPKGAGFLFAREDRREGLSAAVISHGYNGGWPGSTSRFHAQFDWTGTDDPTAWLCVPDAIEFMAGTHPDGWDGVRTANHRLAVEARALLLAALDEEPPAPASMLGSMAAVTLPTPLVQSDTIFDPLMEALRLKWRIEVPIFVWPERPQRVIRISAQRYNSIEQYARLGEALRVELDGGES